MQKFCSNCNGIQGLSFIHGFRRFLLYSTSTLASAEGNPSFVNYLVECQGFSKKQAISTSSKLAHYRQSKGTKKVSDFSFSENADSVISYLKQVGLEQSHIRKVIDCAPHILLCNVDKTLKPKTEIFLKLGFSESDVAEVIKVNPFIFFIGVETTIVPAVESLTETLGSVYHVISILKKFRTFRLTSVSKILVPNVTFLRDFGIPLHLIRKQMLLNTYWLFRKTEYFQDAVFKVEAQFGIPPDAPQFLTGIRLLNTLREETIDSKKQVFKSFGWTESDVVALLRSCPSLLNISEAIMKKKLSFLMNELGYEPSYFASRNAFFTCSLEKRIVPRHKVFQILKEKDLIKMDYGFYRVICLSESRFLRRFVMPFKEVHEVYAKHAGISLERLTVELSKLNSNVA